VDARDFSEIQTKQQTYFVMTAVHV